MNKAIYFTFISLFILSSCVTKKRYAEAEGGRLEAIKQMQKQAENINRLEKDTTEQGIAIRSYREMLNTNLSTQEQLSTTINQKAEELDNRKRTINELLEVAYTQHQKVKTLLGNVQNALLGFNSDELTVMEKNGKVYVAMSDKLLFESGSAKVDKRGKEALAKLAGVLNQQTDIDVYIEGHTDNRPIRTAQFRDNWDLSVMRATSVVRILTSEYGVNPLQVQPTGRSEFMPIAGNDTAEGRSRNRRTEIIMAPKLDKLFEMLNE